MAELNWQHQNNWKFIFVIKLEWKWETNLKWIVNHVACLSVFYFVIFFFSSFTFYVNYETSLLSSLFWHAYASTDSRVQRRSVSSLIWLSALVLLLLSCGRVIVRVAFTLVFLFDTDGWWLFLVWWYWRHHCCILSMSTLLVVVRADEFLDIVVVSALLFRPASNVGCIGPDG